MKSLFYRHRVRATFYHTAAIIFLVTTMLWAGGIVSDAWSFYISASLFAIDYVAEMYDPHPDSPGPWFMAHFHRFFNDDETNNDYEEVPRVSFYRWLITTPE